jgi:hypothetical protein
MLLKIMDTTDDVKSNKCKKKKLWQCNMGDEIKKGKKFNDQKKYIIQNKFCNSQCFASEL